MSGRETLNSPGCSAEASLVTYRTRIPASELSAQAGKQQSLAVN
jgi:hypothetical protein